jgi:hypothetical protein
MLEPLTNSLKNMSSLHTFVDTELSHLSLLIYLTIFQLYRYSNIAVNLKEVEESGRSLFQIC